MAQTQVDVAEDVLRKQLDEIVYDIATLSEFTTIPMIQCIEPETEDTKPVKLKQSRRQKLLPRIELSQDVIPSNTVVSKVKRTHTGKDKTKPKKQRRTTTTLTVGDQIYHLKATELQASFVLEHLIIPFFVSSGKINGGHQ